MSGFFFDPMELFFTTDISGNIATFDQEESRHAVKVLRHKEGDELQFTDGAGTLYKSRIISADPRELRVEITNRTESKKSSRHFHIVIAPTKNIDRIEWFLEKATEIGIDEITPIVCKHSERTVIKKERLEKILVSALKQSGQYTLPKLNDLVSFKEFMKKDVPGLKFIAHCEEQQKQDLISVPDEFNKATILIGPEGDFNTDEIKAAIENGFRPVALGETRLRTETAGLYALNAFHFLYKRAKKD
jgi:16S rRNA (uracil1498-N3)-methyltransferase